jgi:hypothetical protein
MVGYDKAIDKAKALAAEMQAEIDKINLGQAERLTEILDGVMPEIVELVKEGNELGANRPPIANNIVNIFEQLRSTRETAIQIVEKTRDGDATLPVVS